MKLNTPTALSPCQFFKFEWNLTWISHFFCLPSFPISFTEPHRGLVECLRTTESLWDADLAGQKWSAGNRVGASRRTPQSIRCCFARHQEGDMSTCQHVRHFIGKWSVSGMGLIFARSHPQNNNFLPRSFYITFGRAPFNIWPYIAIYGNSLINILVFEIWIINY